MASGAGSMSLNDAAEVALKTADAVTEVTPAGEDASVKKEAPAAEKTTEEKPAVEAKPVVDAETQRAVEIYKIITDPDKGQDFIEYLAKQAGLEVTKQTKKEIVKTTGEFLKEQLGDEYEHLSERLGKAFDILLDQRVKSLTKPLQDEIEQAKARTAEEAADSAIVKFLSENKIAKKDWEQREDKIAAKMAKLPAGADTDVQEYLADIWALVTADETRGRTVKETVKKITDNAKDVRGTSGDVDEQRTRRGSRLPSLDEAIESALRGEKLY